MEAAINVKPFGFDRVFRFAAGEPPPKTNNGELHQQIADLEAQIAALREVHAVEILRIRAEGYEAGLMQARAERDTALLAATDALHAALDDVDARLASTAETMMRDAADLAYMAADVLAGHAVARAPERAIDEALGRVLQQVTRGTQIGIRVHPSLAADMEELIAKRRSQERRKLALVVLEDADMAPGDAQIFWDEGGLGVDAEARRAAVLAEIGPLLNNGAEA